MLDQIIKYSIKNRLLVVAIAAFVISYGAWVLKELPIDVFPDLNRPTVNIMTEAHGLAPEEVETLINMPLENALSGLPGVERIRSSSGVGLSIIYVEFNWGTDIYRNRQMVQEKISLAFEKLPKGITPTLSPISSIMGEIQLIGLSTDDPNISAMQLRGIADWQIRPQLMSIPGVSQVISIGGGVKQYQIQLSAEKIQKHQLSIDDVEHLLADVSKNSTGGFINIGPQEFLIRNIGAVSDKDDILKSVVGMHFAKPVLVRDIADVIEGPEIKRGDASINGKPGVILSIQKQPGASTTELSKKIDLTLKNIKSLPPGIKIEPHLFQQARFIETAIQNVQFALRDGVILVFIILVIFLFNFRTTAITLTAIPLSFLLTALIFKFFGLSINTMTLGGLAVAIGELVDDAIVDVENVFRRLRENNASGAKTNSLKIIFQASSEVRNSIVIATIIVVLVFVPLFNLGGIEGRLFIPLGISYIVSLLASMLVSLTVTPALCAYFLKDDHIKTHQESVFSIKLQSLQRKLLEKVLDNPRPLFILGTLLFLVALVLFGRIGKDFLPQFNEGSAVINVLAAPGISLEESNKIGTMAETLILKTPEVKQVSRRTGRAELDEHAEGIHSSEIEVDFEQDSPRERSVVLDEIRQNLGTIKNVSVNIGQPISHRLDHLLSGVKAQIAIKIFGPDLTTLRAKAAEVENSIKDIPGLVDLQIEQQVLIPQVKIHFLREEASRFGMSVGDIAQLLEKTLQGEVVGQIIENQRTIDVFMRFDEKSRNDLELIKKTPIKYLPDGSRISIEDVADVYESTGPNLIQRENNQRRIVIQANTTNRSLNKIMNELKMKIDSSVQLSDEYHIVFGGQYESQVKSSKTILLLSLISISLIFIILFSNFRSVFITIQIMLNIPMAFIGGVFAIFFTGGSISIASLVAFVTLCGIASRNGIMMISHYLHLLKHERENFSKEMVIRGSMERLVPVLMTASTAMLGLLPIAVEAHAPGREILHPLATVIIGGLISSTLLDMYLTPAIFYHFGKNSALRSISQDESDGGL